MAPEQFADANQCNELSDLYSFGIVLYEMISGGRWPYGDLGSLDSPDWADPIMKIHAAHCHSKPRRLSHPFFKLAAWCLEKRPEARITSFAAVRDELSSLGRRAGMKFRDTSPGEDLDFWDKGRKATSLYQLGRHEEALILYDEMLQLFSFDELTLFNKALTLTALDRIGEAIDLYRKLLRQNPAHTGALTNLATLLINQKNLADAEELLLKAISIDPDSFEVRINLGNVCYRRAQFASAASQYESALKIEPFNSTGWHNLALALLAQGKREEARASLLAFMDYADPEDYRITWVKNKLDAL